MRVAIVGAGICGLYLGWKLAEKGEDVTVFEKKEKIGKEACSGLFSERIFKFIPHRFLLKSGEGFIHESRSLIQNRIKHCLIHFPERTLKIEFEEKFSVINHFELDGLVAALAEKAGAKIVLNHPVTSLPEGFDRIIGCDGANSVIRKSLGLPEPDYRLGVQGSLAQTGNPNLVETWPTEHGFIWKIPRNGETEYGIIERPKLAKKLFDKFLKENNLVLDSKSINSALIPRGLIIPKNPKVTLCGDASGLTKPWSGGGVIWGLTAADILLKNFPDFLKYQKEAKRFFSPKITFSKAVTSMVYFLGFKTPWILPKNVKIDGDFLVK